MGKRARKNPYCQHLLDAGFTRYRYKRSTGNGYNNKDRAGPPTWRKFAPVSNRTLHPEQLHPGDWVHVEKRGKQWVCYSGNWAHRIWTGPGFATSTAAFVHAELNNWGRM